MPQELIDAIVHEIGDSDSLKACSLAASAFRPASQRGLIHTMTIAESLTDKRQSASAWRTLFEESPHLSGYITTVQLSLSRADAVPSAVQTLQVLLPQLKNVRYCMLLFNGEAWSTFLPVAAVLTRFIRHTMLQDLHIRDLTGLPPSTFALLLSSARTLSFGYVDGQVDNIEDAEWPHAPAGSNLEQLLLDVGSTSLSRMLADPRVRVHTADLRRLSVHPGQLFAPTTLKIAGELEHLRFDFGCESLALFFCSDRNLFHTAQGKTSSMMTSWNSFHLSSDSVPSILDSAYTMTPLLSGFSPAYLATAHRTSRR